MAIRRLDPKAVKKVVSAMDDAIDHDKSNLAMYAQTLDLKHMVFKEGMKPSFFLIRPIDPIAELKINEAHQRITPPTDDGKGNKTKAKVEFIQEGEACLKYFEQCVKEIDEDGQITPINPKEFQLAILQEVGSYAMLYSKVGENLKKA